MKKKKITEKFYGGGIEISPSLNETIFDIDRKEIIEVFEKNGLILFRNFEFNPNETTKFTDNFSLTYANDALRRDLRMGDKKIRNVDYGNKEMAFHSEASFAPSWPEIIWFYCEDFAKNSKGSTTFCDGIKLWDALSIETKHFFLHTPIKYNLKIPILIKKNNSKKKEWFLNSEGAGKGLLDFNKGFLKIDQTRFAVHQSRIINKLCFSNHALYKDTDPTILKWGTIFGKKIPKKILDETNEKSKEITYDHEWKKKDFIMIDNQRFLHGRRCHNIKDKRDIVVIQTLLANFGYGSTTRKING